MMLHKLNHTIFLFEVMVFISLLSCQKETVITKKSKPEVIIAENDSRLSDGTIHFVKDTVYVLAANLIRNSGQILLIDAGTLVKVKDKFSITINPGGRIEANGTREAPVVFTSATPKGGAGLLVNNAAGGQSFWYGIRINGSAGTSSGKLNFVRIEFAGGNDFITGTAALLLKNADSLTTIQNIQVSYSFETPSFGFSGGRCSGSNLVSYAASFSDFNIEEGWVGGLQNLLAYRHPYFAPAAGSGISLAGLLISGDKTYAVISNLSVIGPDIQKGTSLKYFDTISAGPFGTTLGSSVAALLVKSGKFHIRNSVFCGFPKTGFYLDELNAAIALRDDVSEFAHSIVESNDSSRAFYLPVTVFPVSPPVTSKDFKEYMLRPVYNNLLFYDFASFGFTDPFNYDTNPNPLPNPGSPMLTGANFEGPVFSNVFFKKVNYRGAVGTDNWMQGWTNFIPLQTDYNN